MALILNLITVKEAMDLEHEVGLYGILGFFTFAVVFSACYSFLMMPETFGLSLQVYSISQVAFHLGCVSVSSRAL